MCARHNHFVKNGVCTKDLRFYVPIKTIHNQAKDVIMDYHYHETKKPSNLDIQLNKIKATGKLFVLWCLFILCCRPVIAHSS